VVTDSATLTDIHRGRLDFAQSSHKRPAGDLRATGPGRAFPTWGASALRQRETGQAALPLSRPHAQIA
jgi:hypothetical protein